MNVTPKYTTRNRQVQQEQRKVEKETNKTSMNHLLKEIRTIVKQIQAENETTREEINKIKRQNEGYADEQKRKLKN
jgi:hypothetical protein